MSGGERGYPIPGPGVPHLRSGGVPISGPEGGVLHLRSGGYLEYPPHHLDLAGVPPLGWGTPPAKPGMGYPPARPGMGYPPYPDLRWGRPPPPVEVWTDTQSENITFPHPSDAGGNKRRVEAILYSRTDR